MPLQPYLMRVARLRLLLKHYNLCCFAITSDLNKKYIERTGSPALVARGSHCYFDGSYECRPGANEQRCSPQ